MRLGQGNRAYELMQGVLARPELNWPAAYHHALRADALQHVGRLDDALAEAEAAITGFVEMGYPIEANGIRLQTADLLLLLDRPGDALERIDEALSSAERLPNRAHMGMARGLLGRALVCVGDQSEALNALTEALGTLDGLGWLRHEAELSLVRYEVACRASFVGPRQREQWQADTEARVRRLRSVDLLAALRRLAQTDR
jgi:tetratricopeptide (TPR) repeat protein